jgi:predicted AAA+ superfamily ATPase
LVLSQGHVILVTANAAAAGECELFYWRDRGVEVDFIVRSGHEVTAIEVKSGRTPNARSGLMAFGAAFKPQRKLLVGGDGITVDGNGLNQLCTIPPI